MPLDATMIKFYYTGGGTAVASLGGSATANECGISINSLFGNITSTEAASGIVKYRAVDAKNEHGGKSITDAALFRSSATTSATTEVWLAFDSVATQSIANELTAPTGLTFYNTAVSRATGIALSTPWTAGTKQRLWLKLVVDAGTSTLAVDAGELAVIGDRVP